MKLNNDLVREILLYIENITDGVKPNYKEIKIDGYTQGEIVYHLKILGDAGYVKVCNGSFISPVCFERLTYSGHEYIESIRNKYIWQEVKREIETSGLMNTTFDIIKKLANKLIRDRLGI